MAVGLQIGWHGRKHNATTPTRRRGDCPVARGCYTGPGGPVHRPGEPAGCRPGSRRGNRERRGAMELLLEAARALGLIVAMIVAVLLAPLVFMVIFSLVTGFDDQVERLERSARDE